MNPAKRRKGKRLETGEIVVPTLIGEKEAKKRVRIILRGQNQKAKAKPK